MPAHGDAEPPEGAGRWRLLGIFFLLGAYGGFLQAGFGFVALAVLSVWGLDLVRANAVKVALVLAFTPIALGIFAFNGLVDWTMGVSLAAGNVIGGLAGVHLQVVRGQKWVRGVITATVVIFGIRLLMMG